MNCVSSWIIHDSTVFVYSNSQGHTGDAVMKVWVELASGAPADVSEDLYFSVNNQYEEKRVLQFAENVASVVAIEYDSSAGGRGKRKREG